MGSICTRGKDGKQNLKIIFRRWPGGALIWGETPQRLKREAGKKKKENIIEVKKKRC